MNKKEFKNALDHACIYMELQADDVAHDYLIEAFYDIIEVVGTMAKFRSKI